MPLEPDRAIRYLVDERSAYPDPFVRGLAYLQQVQHFALDANLIDLRTGQREQLALCTWLGLHIDTVNTELNACLQACQACFHEWERRSAQVFAAPFKAIYGIDGFCNLHTTPATILIDAGRVVSSDWLGLVAHEYAHVHVGAAGHGPLFFQVISHLCLGLGLPLPAQVKSDRPSLDPLSQWPPSRSRAEAIEFWQGLHWPCALPMTEYYSR